MTAYFREIHVRNIIERASNDRLGVHLTDLFDHFRITPPIRPGSYGRTSCEGLRLEVLDISPKTCRAV